MQRFKVRIQGASPLLMHRFSEEAQAKAAQTIRSAANIKDSLPREEAEKCAYRLEDGRLYMPSIAVMRSFQGAASNYKQRGTRKSLKYVAAGGFITVGDKMPLDGEVKDFEVFSCPVVIPATKGRVMRHRPKVEQWSITFEVDIDTTVLEASDCKRILEEAGTKVGIGDWRPEKCGPYGRFQVVSWEPLQREEGDVNHAATGRRLAPTGGNGN